MKLADAAVTLIAEPSTPQDSLTYFGRCFIRAAGAFKYETLIKVKEDFPICVALHPAFIRLRNE